MNGHPHSWGRLVESNVTIDRGRSLSYADLGEPEGHVVFYFHGTPSSRLDLAWLDAAFRQAGLRVVAPDRPGYGRSSPHAGRTVADWAEDVNALSAALGADRFAVVGVSGGGPHALACAAHCPGVRAAAVVGGQTDMSWPGARSQRQHMAGLLGPDEDAAAKRIAEVWGIHGESYLARVREGLARGATQFPEPDRLFLSDPDRQSCMLASLGEAFTQGVVGVAHDLWALHQPWSFDPKTITVPVEILHGQHDTNIPASYGRHTAELIPGAKFTQLAGHGHLSARRELPDLMLRLTQ